MYAQRNGAARGIDFLCFGNGLVFLAFLLFLVPQELLLLSGVLPNICLIVGVTVLNVGIRQFFDLREMWGANLLIMGVGAVSISVLTYKEAHLAYLILVVSGVISLVVGWIAFVIWRMRPRDHFSIAYYFASGAGLWIALWHGLRCIVHLSGADASTSLMAPTSWNLTFFAVTTASIPAFWLGMVVLIQDRTVSAMRMALTFDDLTGAWSRQSFLNECKTEFGHIVENNGIATVIYLDVDRFKRTNEQFGRINGDLALQYFAKVVGTCIRHGDRLGRMGGEEFAVLLGDTGPQDAATIAGSICQAVRQSPLKVDAEVIGMTVSIGVATARPGEAELDVISRADAAAHEAKLDGGDRFRVADFDLPRSMFPVQSTEEEALSRKFERRA
ncbi:MAG: GGDEF domain-containing protein [Phyllobacterium sp.]